MANPSDRRVFINNGDKFYQIYSFSQSVDGSIYCSSPDFATAKWFGITPENSEYNLQFADNIGDGKISIHGSGIASIRPHLDPHNRQIIIKGNKLLNQEKNERGVRHLFTSFIKEPSYIPLNSPVFNRLSDFIMKYNGELRPFVLVFLAIPQTNLELSFQISIDIDFLNRIPDDMFLGHANISLRYHNVYCYAYRTINMEKWPKYSHYVYSDGYVFPIFIGIEPNLLIVYARMPTYQIEQNILSIEV